MPNPRNAFEFSARDESANGDNRKAAEISPGFERLKSGGLNVEFQLPSGSGFVQTRICITLLTVSLHGNIKQPCSNESI